MNNKEYDSDLSIKLNKPLDDRLPLDDLNYEWICNNNSYIVICGDIIDPIKRHVCKKTDSDVFCHYYRY